jgi:hypothetical protein
MVSALIEKIAAALERHRLPYMVTGGQAVIVYGQSRLTKDIDLTLGVDVDSLEVVMQCLREIDLEVLVSEVRDFVQTRMVLPLRDPTSGWRVDVTFSNSEYEREALKQARPFLIGQTKVRYISPEDLVIHKIIAGRPRDLEDVKVLLLKNPKLDRTYIETWLKAFDQDLAGDYLQILRGIEERLRK